MPTLNDLAEEHTSLGEADVEHLHSLVSDWQLLADLSFADLLLWVPRRGRHRLAGHRPDAPDHRADRATRTTWSAPSPGRRTSGVLDVA